MPAQPDTNPASALPDPARAARRAQFLTNLDQALKIAEKLGESVAKAFPGAASDGRAALDPNLSVDERIRLGESAARELTAIAMHLAPEATLDSLEKTLDGDCASQRQASELMTRLARAE